MIQTTRYPRPRTGRIIKDVMAIKSNNEGIFMQKVVLQFQTPQDLVNFRVQAGDKIIKTEVVNLILHCECNKELIAVAMTKYGAIVKEIPE